METGLLTFDDRHHYHAQVIGSYAEEDGSWLWAWANKQSQIPSALLVAADRLRKVGDKLGIDALRTATFKIPRTQIAALAMAAAGAVDAKAFYIGGGQGQLVVFLVDDGRVSPLPEADAVHVINIFNELVSRFPIPDHRRAYEAYLRARGFSVENHGNNQLMARHPKAGALVAEFDALGRLAKASTVVSPNPRDP